MRRLRVVLLMIAAATPLVASPQAPPPSGLAALLGRELARFPATTGIFVKHLDTGETAGVRADQAFSSASLIKLTFMLRAYRLADEGHLDLRSREVISRAQWRHGTGTLQYLEPGIEPTLRDLITQMIIVSDNTATDRVIEAVGGIDAVNGWLASRGYADLHANGRPHEYRRVLLGMLDPALADLTAEETTGLLYAMDGNPLFTAYRTVFTGPKAAWVDIVTTPANRQRFARLREEETSRNPALWLGSMTPRATARLLEDIARGTAASPYSTAEMLNALRRQQLGARRLPHFVAVPVAHKTGDGGTIANDAGILYTRSGPVVVAFFANGIQGPYAEAEDRIGRIGRLIVEYFDGRR
ncbi:MAG: serine hydrolase [Vicinamibacterales bacterium]